MRILQIEDEVFSDYSKISMLVVVPFCTTCCWKELGLDSSICQNDNPRGLPILDYSNRKIIERYVNNPLTNAIVFGGMDAWDSINEIIELIKLFRETSDDDVVLYTGRKYSEIASKMYDLERFKNVYVKVGRYIPNQKPVIDKITGVKLANRGQYFIKV